MADKDFAEDKIDFTEIAKRAIKYFIEGAVVAFCAYFIPKRGKGGKALLSLEEILMIAFVAAAVFALMDMYAPAIAPHARLGAGFGVGSALVGFPGMPVGI